MEMRKAPWKALEAGGVACPQRGLKPGVAVGVQLGQHRGLVGTGAGTTPTGI